MEISSINKPKRLSVSSATGFGSSVSCSIALIEEEKSNNPINASNTEQGDHKNQVIVTGKQFIINEDNIISSKPTSPTNNQKELISSFNKQVTSATDSKRSSVDRKSDSTSSDQKDQDEKLESAKAEMSEVRVENERLKTTLSQVVKDYQSLQMHFFDIVQQEQTKKPMSMDITPSPPAPAHQQVEIEEEHEFISLSLGRSSSTCKTKKDEKISNNSNKLSKEENDQVMKEGLSLGLDCKFEVSNLSGPSELASNPSPDNSFEEPKEEEAGEQWAPGKMLKTVRSGDDEVSQQSHVKKARVSVRARCDTPTMNDGCQWRKYGQKIAKGNPCPRAYYRCTVAPACPVRKQVQRCAENMSILITTYEGTHNHPLPISATAMASTTSAAASMLLSGSTSSRPNLGQSAINTTGTDLHGLNFSLSDNSRSRQFYLPNSSISSAPPYPTITLDLTAPPSSASSSASSSAGSQFSRLSSNFPTTRYSPTSFNFSSASESISLPTSWGNGYLNYGTHQSYNKNQIGALNLGKQPQQEQFYQPYLQKSNSVEPPQQSMTDTIAAATKAITSDPSFRSALAAAITSIVGGSAGANGSQVAAENFGQNLKWE